MALKRQLTALIWAAAVLVAAQFLPGVAQAHSGHDHASHSVAVASSELSAEPAKPAEATRAAAVTELASADSDAMPAAPSGGCNGSCCGTGAGCCGAALLFSPSAALPKVGVARQPIGSASPIPPGIDPDALRKPPKSFA
jgi:hypothetical protein